MSVTLHLDAETERKLRNKASLCGQTLDMYLQQLAERDAGTNGTLVLPPDFSDAEAERLLDDLASGPSLLRAPDNLSRADIYADHD